MSHADVLVVVIAVVVIALLVVVSAVYRRGLSRYDTTFCGVCDLKVPRHRTVRHSQKGEVCGPCAHALAAEARDKHSTAWRYHS